MHWAKMSDILERLLEWELEGRWRGNTDLYETLYEARMEIERLREVEDDLRTSEKEWKDGYHELRAALQKIIRNDPEGYEASIAREALGDE